MGVTNFDIVQANAFIGTNDLPAGGTHYYVRPYTGLDGNNGKSPTKAFKTLLRAKTVAASGKNDIIHFIGEGNAAAYCTDYQSALLDWNKDLLHLIGENDGTRMSPRCRIGWKAGTAAATGLFKVSGNGCLIRGVQIWGGIDGNALALGGAEVTGRLNRFQRCHFSAMDGAAGVNDIVGAYSVKITGGIENEFEDCVIGNDTTSIGGASHANSQILFSTNSQENLFRRCSIVMSAGSSTYHVFFRAPTASLVTWCEFEDCEFINIGTNLTVGAVVATDCGGLIFFRGASHAIYGASGWGANYSKIIGLGYTQAVATSGFSAAISA